MNPLELHTPEQQEIIKEICERIRKKYEVKEKVKSEQQLKIEQFEKWKKS